MRGSRHRDNSVGRGSRQRQGKREGEATDRGRATRRRVNRQGQGKREGETVDRDRATEKERQQTERRTKEKERQ